LSQAATPIKPHPIASRRMDVGSGTVETGVNCAKGLSVAASDFLQ